MTKWLMDEFTGLSYPASQIKTAQLCNCEKTHNGIVPETKKCNCNNKIEK